MPHSHLQDLVAHQFLDGWEGLPLESEPAGEGVTQGIPLLFTQSPYVTYFTGNKMSLVGL